MVLDQIVARMLSGKWLLPVDKQAQTAPNNEDEESNMGYGAHLGANFRAAGRALTKHPKGTPVTHILSDTAEHVLHGLIPLIKWEHQQPSMPFPEEELDAYRRRLAAGPAYTTRVSAERGRYKEGDEVTSPLGALRITQVQRFKAGTRHPFADELTPAQLQQIQGPYDLIKFETVKQAQAVTPGLGIPDMAVYGDVLGSLKPGDITDWVLQRHDTVRNPKNPHYDMRLGTKDTNLFSWAVPGATMPAPGQIKRPLPQTQLHTYQYGSFEGKIDCVVAGTLITCADGPHPIEKLQPDRDEVHVLGLGSRGLTFYRVQRLYRNVTRHQWLRLCVQAVNGELHTLVCGPEHGLYRLGQGFIRAKDITVGHTVALHHGTEPLFQHIMAAGADQYEISRVMGGADDPGHQMVHAQILGRPATTADTVTCSHNAYRTLPVLPVHRPCVIDGAPTHCARPAQSLYSMALKRFLDTLSANVQRVRDLCLTKTFVKVHSAQGCSVAECWRRTVTQYLCCAFARCTEILHNQCAQLFMLVRRSAGVQAFTYDYAAIDAQPVRDLCEGQSGPQQRQNLSFVERTAPTHLSPQLSDTNGISWGTIVQVESVTESQEAFDLLVDDAHNYFAQGLLVHNSGYGKGTVKMQDKGQAIVTRVTPNTLHFTLGHKKVPTRYVLIHTGGKTGKMWQLYAKPNASNILGVGDKPVYKTIQADSQDDAIAQAQELQEKIDGAHGIINVGPKGEVDAYSIRRSVGGAPISHTERMQMFGLRVPTRFKGQSYRGEMYFTDAKDRAVAFKDVSGLLNMLPARSIEAQRQRGLRPRIALFDQVSDAPRTQRQQAIQELIQNLPPELFHTPAAARTQSEKEQLFRTIAEGKNPRTGEGVMAVMPDDSVAKIKNKEETTGYVTGTFPGTGKRQGTAGGLTFVTDREQKGVPEGKVGTGFTDRELQDIVARIEELRGQPFRIEHMGRFSSGKLRAPSFKGFETDKVAMIKDAIIRRRGKNFTLFSRKGKVLGIHRSRAAAQKQERAVYAHKSASVRLARELPRLLPLAQQDPALWQKLLKALPQGSTRSIGTKALGAGAEGTMYPTFTGGKGLSATKVMFDFFNSGSTGKVGPATAALVEDMSPRRLPLARHVQLLQQFPDLFPKVYGTHARGFTVERLYPMAATPSYKTQLRTRLRDTVAKVRAANTPVQQAMAESDLRRMWLTRDFDFNKWRLLGKRIARNGFERTADGRGWSNGTIGIADVHAGHNHMSTATHRSVISDPWFFDAKHAQARPQFIQQAIFGGNRELLQRAGSAKTPAKRLAAQIRAYYQTLPKQQVQEHIQHPDLQHVLSWQDKTGASTDTGVRLRFLGKDGIVKASALVEVADTPALRRQGLTGRTELADGRGMFFDKSGTYWMKGLEFPLDIVFVDDNGRILEKQSMGVEPDPDQPQCYYTGPGASAHAIELPAGWCVRNGIGVGDKVTV